MLFVSCQDVASWQSAKTSRNNMSLYLQLSDLELSRNVPRKMGDRLALVHRGTGKPMKLGFACGFDIMKCIGAKQARCVCIFGIVKRCDQESVERRGFVLAGYGINGDLVSHHAFRALQGPPKKIRGCFWPPRYDGIPVCDIHCGVLMSVEAAH